MQKVNGGKGKIVGEQPCRKKTIFEEKHKMLTIPDEKRAAMKIELRQAAGREINQNTSLLIAA